MRYSIAPILTDLKSKMVFIGGPRQVGKTTLAQAVLSNNILKILSTEQNIK